MNPLNFAYIVAAASAEAAENTGGGNNPIAIDMTLPVMIVSFLILVYVLAKFAWQPLMSMMEKRRQFIEDSLAHAEKERLEAQRIREEYQTEMRNARREAQEVIDKAAKVAEDTSAKIIADARQETEKMKSAAVSEIERERDKAIADVKAEVADLSVAVAEKIIRQKLDLQGQEALIDQFIQEVGDKPC